MAVALVDDADYPLVAGQRWHLHSRDGYAVSKRTVAGRRVSELMHRVVVGLALGDPWEVDHRDGNRLDCRRANLRVLTTAQNSQNRTVVTGRSRFRNVSWHKASGRWQVKLTVNYRQVHGGLFERELDAALRAQAMRDELMPFALPDPELVAELGRLDAVA